MSHDIMQCTDTHTHHSRRPLVFAACCGQWWIKSQAHVIEIHNFYTMSLITFEIIDQTVGWSMSQAMARYCVWPNRAPWFWRYSKWCSLWWLQANVGAEFSHALLSHERMWLKYHFGICPPRLFEATSTSCLWPIFVKGLGHTNGLALDQWHERIWRISPS